MEMEWLEYGQPQAVAPCRAPRIVCWRLEKVSCTITYGREGDERYADALSNTTTLTIASNSSVSALVMPRYTSPRPYIGEQFCVDDLNGAVTVLRWECVWQDVRFWQSCTVNKSACVLD